MSIFTFIFYLLNNYFLKYSFINWCSYDVKLDSRLHDQIKMIFAMAPLIYLIGEEIKRIYFLKHV